MCNRAAIAHLGSFDAKCLSLTIDPFARGPLGVDGMIQWTFTIQQSTHQASFLPIGIFDTAFGFGKWGMVTGLPGWFRKEEWTAKALGAKAIGVGKQVGGMHAQAFGATWGAIGVAWHFFVPMTIERDGGDALSVSHRLIDIPVVVSGISGHMRRELVGARDRALIEGTIVGDIGFIEGQGVLGKHHIAVDGIGGHCDARAITKQNYLFLFGRPIGLHLIAALLDAESTIGITFGVVRYVIAAFGIDERIVLTDPSVH